MVEGAGSVIFGVARVTPRRNTNSSSASGCVRLSLRCRIGRGEIDLVALVVAKLEQRAAHLEALDALDEPAPVGAAAEFAVGHDLEADLLLHAHRRRGCIRPGCARIARRRSRRCRAGGTPAAAPAGAAGCRHGRRETAGGRRGNAHDQASGRSCFYSSIDKI